MDRINYLKPAYFMQGSTKLDGGLVSVSVKSEGGRAQQLRIFPANWKWKWRNFESALNIGADVDHARRFHNLGFSVFLFSYRGYGLSDGEFPSEAQMYADAEAAWDYLVKQKHIKPDRIFIYGPSIVGAIAIVLACMKKCQLLND